MFVTVRHSTVTSTDEVIRQSKEDLLPNTLSKLPGFISFYFVKVSDTELITFTIYETKEQSEVANRAALDWIRQRLSQYLVSGPEITIGELAFSQFAKKEFPGQMAA